MRALNKLILSGVLLSQIFVCGQLKLTAETKVEVTVLDELKKANPLVTAWRPLFLEKNPAGARLTWDMNKTAIRNIEPLKMVVLENLYLNETLITDISSLKGMPLKKLTLENVKVSDISALEGMPLEELSLQGTQVQDLGPLKGMPLKKLSIRRTLVSNIKVLQGMNLINLEIPSNLYDVSFLYSMKSLQRINGKVPSRFWREYDERNLAIAKEFPELSKMVKNAEQQLLIDNPSMLLKNKMTIKKESGRFKMSWDLSGANIKNISALKRLPLYKLDLSNNPIVSIEPLKGMPLNWLNLNNTDLSDIRALEGMPVRDLKLAGTKITNSQVLKGLRYHSLVIPENFKELEFIRARQKYYIYRKNKRKLTRWVMINGLPANEFLENYYSKN